jgi:predicted small lipoprotein YifL
MNLARANHAMLACALLAVAVAGGLSGCGLKGSLYLPKQQKSKVPETTNNPAADAPDQSAPQPNPAPTDEPRPTDQPPPNDAAPGDSKPHA